LIIILLTLAANLSGQMLVYRSGVLTFTVDRPDTNLLLQADQELRNLDLVFGALSGLRVQDSIRVNFYFNRQLAGDVLPDAPYWSGGIARSGNQIHIFSQDRRSWYTTLKHELVHTVLRQNDIRVPTWFEEGLAETFADQWTWRDFNNLGSAVMRRQVIPLIDINRLNTFNRSQAQLAYSQSMHVTRFLMKRHGEDVIQRLLAMGDVNFRDHFNAVTSESLADFEIAWRDHLKREFWFFGISQIPGWLWVLMPLIVVVAFVQKFISGRRQLKEWADEEEAEEQSGPYDA
jgi:hypothetical protein